MSEVRGSPDPRLRSRRTSGGWNRISRVFSGWTVKPYLLIRLGNTFMIRRASVSSGRPDHEVVRVANQEGIPFQSGANFRLEPVVEHVVQEDVGQKRTDHSTLRRAVLGDRENPLCPAPPR